jgi:uncharacterized membrane protein
VAHLFPAMAPFKRKRLIVKIGLIPYKISFALIIILSIALMVFGWRSIIPMHLYQLPELTHYITLLLVLISFILFVAAQVKTNIKRVLRHPQLTALVLWSIGHVLVNGDIRSLVLFLGLLLWAKIQVITTNKRDGKRELPDKVNIKNDIFTVIGGVTVFIIMIFVHPYLTGISIL